jgi:hypothetical protein
MEAHGRWHAPARSAATWRASVTCARWGKEGGTAAGFEEEGGVAALSHGDGGGVWTARRRRSARTGERLRTREARLELAFNPHACDDQCHPGPPIRA